MSFDVRGDTARLRRVRRTPPPEAECTFAVLASRAQKLTGGHAGLREVRFVHAQPVDTAPYAALFRCPVHFARPASEIIFDAKSLALPVASANPGLESVLERYMSELVARLPKSDAFIEQVRSSVARTLRTKAASLDETARDLRVSARTLQRKLGEDGTSHSEIVDSVRSEMAERLVADDRMSLTEIAFLLGFADVSGFRRRYKRWTGTSPAAARKRIRTATVEPTAS
jgi:AraC-like DNA-binding protein